MSHREFNFGNNMNYGQQSFGDGDNEDNSTGDDFFYVNKPTSKFAWDDVRAELASLDISESELMKSQRHVETLEDLSEKSSESPEDVTAARKAMDGLMKYGPTVIRTAVYALSLNIPKTLVEITKLADELMKQWRNH